MVESNLASPLIYFIHIEKTAGSSLRAYFRRAFGFDKCLFHDPAIIRERPVDLLALAASNPESLLRYRVLGGHIGFRRIPEVTLGRPTIFVSILRDPIARVVSHYQHVRTKPAHPMHNQFVNRTLFQAMHATLFTAMVDRLQIRALCGRKALPALREEMDRQQYIVGKQEHIQDLFNHLSCVFGHRTITDLNVNAGLPGYKEEIRAQPRYDDAIDIICEMNRAEYNFYESFSSIWSNI